MPPTAVSFASYHNHTVWSDGDASLMEMIDAAQAAGLSEFGISDHFIAGSHDFGPGRAIIPELLDEYIRNVRQAKDTATKMEIRLGLEVDYIPETFEATVGQLERHNFDYLIGSVHRVDDFLIDRDYCSWSVLSPVSLDRVWRLYWRRIREAAETGFFDIIGHLDLPKIFAFYPSTDLTREALNALDAIAGSDTAIEMNTAGWDRPVKEAYPSLFYLREAKRRNIPLVISTDAHEVDHIDRYLDRARRLALLAGYKETAYFKLRKRSLRKL
jgi:histidinol-phosphatase (PHP family)